MDTGYTKLQLIHAATYEEPPHLIQYQGDPLTDPADIEAELDAAEYKGAAPTIEAHVRGHDDYTVLISCTDEHGETRYYLAK